MDARRTGRPAAEQAEQSRVEAEQLAREKQEVNRREAEAAAAKQPSKTDPLVTETADERRAKAGVKRYRTVHGGNLTDPSTLKVFTPEGNTKSELTSWMEYQIKHNKLEVSEE